MRKALLPRVQEVWPRRCAVQRTACVSVLIREARRLQSSAASPPVTRIEDRLHATGENDVDAVGAAREIRVKHGDAAQAIAGEIGNHRVLLRTALI